VRRPYKTASPGSCIRQNEGATTPVAETSNAHGRAAIAALVVRAARGNASSQPQAKGAAVQPLARGPIVPPTHPPTSCGQAPRPWSKRGEGAAGALKPPARRVPQWVRKRTDHARTGEGGRTMKLTQRRIEGLKCPAGQKGHARFRR
jgi:hypothetical protein